VNYGTWTTGNGLITQNAWYHIACIFTDPSTAVFYINGTLRANTGGNTGAFAHPPDTVLSLGTMGAGAYGKFDGIIDSACMWNRVLSSNEVWTLYNSGAGLPEDLSVAPYNVGLVGCWPMNENVASNALDISGNSNTGTALNISWALGKVVNPNGVSHEVVLMKARNGQTPNDLAEITVGDTNIVLKMGSAVSLPVLSTDPAVQTWPQLYGKAYGTTNSAYGIDSIGNVTRIFSMRMTGLCSGRTTSFRVAVWTWIWFPSRIIWRASARPTSARPTQFLPRSCRTGMRLRKHGIRPAPTTM